MQEEILKHSRKIKAAVRNGNHSFVGKIKEVLIEAGIIVFAVSLSIWLHGINEHKHQQEEVATFLAEIKNDLEIDIKNLAYERSKKIKDIQFFETILHSKVSDSSIHDMDFGLVLRITLQANYEGFKSSGKIGYIEDKIVKKKILAYYQQEMSQIAEIEKLYNSLLLPIAEVENFNVNEIKKKIAICMGIAESLKKGYDNQIKNATEIINQITCCAIGKN